MVEKGLSIVEKNVQPHDEYIVDEGVKALKEKMYPKMTKVK